MSTWQSMRPATARGAALARIAMVLLAAGCATQRVQSLGLHEGNSSGQRASTAEMYRAAGIASYRTLEGDR